MRSIKIIATLFTAFIIFVIYSANTGSNSWLFAALSNVPYADKMMHFLLVGLLTFIVNLALQIRTIDVFNQKILLGSFIIFWLITLEEFSQIWVARRNFDLLDLSADYLGMLVFGFLAVKVYHRIR